MANKGKEISGKASSVKRKAVSKGYRKKKRPHVLKFIDDEAVDAEINGNEEDDGVGDEDDRDFINDGESEIKDKKKSGKVHSPPILVKEEDLSDGELENILKYRYSRDSGHVTYTDEGQETKEGDEMASSVYSMKEPTVWKVKCAVGHERQVAFCLIQKYVDMQSLGTKLQIISAFSLEHVKGYIYIEADRERDVVEACKGLCSIYPSRVVLVPKNEVRHLLCLQVKPSEVSKDTWVRVKNGKYKGDLAQVVAVDYARKRATIKLIPRIDLQAMAQKYSGVTVKQASVPAPRLISSCELEVFRDHIQCRRDPENGETFEILDRLMLKDGYLYKKVSIGSLCCWEIQPSPNEIQNFKIPREDASEDLAWLSALYGDLREGVDMMGEASKSNLESKSRNSFELHDLVLLGRKDFGVIIGVESDSFQIIKGNAERAEIVTVQLQDIKNLCFDKKIKVPDLHMNIISIDDSVKVLEGAYKGRQGIVRHIYKGMVFIYDGNESENCGFFCAKSEYCEKYSKDGAVESPDDGLDPPGFGDSMASPTVPQSPRRPFNASTRAFNSNFLGDRDRDFSIGQTLRIRVGPLKGYLCRVVAIYRSDVTVKLDSQLKVIRVNCEHLCEAGVTGFGNAIRDSLHDLSTSGFSLQVKSPTADPFGTVHSFADHELGKDEAVDPWGSRTSKSKDQTALQNKATAGDQVFGAVATDGWRNPKLPMVDESDVWKNTGDWGKEKPESGNQANHSTNRMGWLDKSEGASNDQVGGWKKSESGWDKEKHVSGYQKDNWKSENGNCWGKEANNHDKGKRVSDKQNCWNHAQVADQDQPRFWNKRKGVMCEEADSSGKAFERKGNENIGSGNQGDTWGKATGSWKGAEGSGGSKVNSWKNTTAARNEKGGWAPPDVGYGDEAGSWNKAKGEGGSQFRNWGKPNDRNEGGPSGWNKAGFCSQVQIDGWNKGKDANKDMGGRRDQTDGWNRPKDFDGGWDSGCNKGRMGNFEGGNRYQEDSWNKPKSFDGGRGSGGRRGRGGYRGGSGDGRGSGRGRDQLSGWNKDQDDHWNGDGAFPASRGNGDQVEGCNDGKGFPGNQAGWKNGGNWNTPKIFCGNQSTVWCQASAANEEAGGSGDQAMGWNKRKATGGDQMPCWKSGERGAGGDGEQTGCWNGGNSFGGHKSSSWNKGTNSKGGAGDRPNSFGGDQSSGWNRGMHAYRDGGSSDQNANWNIPKSFGRGQSSGWNKGAGHDKEKPSSFVPGQSPGCKKGVDATKEADGSGNPVDSSNKSRSFGRGQSSGWNRGSGANKEVDGSGNPSDSWNRPRSNSRGQPSGGTVDTFTNKGGGFGNWNKATAFGGDESFSQNQGANEGACGNAAQSEVWSQQEAAGNGQRSSSWSKDAAASKAAGGSGQGSNSWNQLRVFGGNQRSGLNDGNKDGANRQGPTKGFNGNRRSGWNVGPGQGEGWNGGKGSTRASGPCWNNVTAATKGASGSGPQVDGWNHGGKSGDGDQASGWNRATTSGHQVGGWDKAAGGSWRQGNSGGRGKGGC